MLIISQIKQAKEAFVNKNINLYLCRPNFEEGKKWMI